MRQEWLYSSASTMDFYKVILFPYLLTSLLTAGFVTTGWDLGRALQSTLPSTPVLCPFLLLSINSLLRRSGSCAARMPLQRQSGGYFEYHGTRVSTKLRSARGAEGNSPRVVMLALLPTIQGRRRRFEAASTISVGAVSLSVPWYVHVYTCTVGMLSENTHSRRLAELSFTMNRGTSSVVLRKD
jgi:hypothetical protein